MGLWAFVLILILLCVVCFDLCRGGWEGRGEIGEVFLSFWFVALVGAGLGGGGSEGTGRRLGGRVWAEGGGVMVQAWGTVEGGGLGCWGCWGGGLGGWGVGRGRVGVGRGKWRGLGGSGGGVGMGKAL